MIDPYTFSIIPDHIGKQSIIMNGNLFKANLPTTNQLSSNDFANWFTKQKPELKRCFPWIFIIQDMHLIKMIYARRMAQIIRPNSCRIKESNVWRIVCYIIKRLLEITRKIIISI